MCSEDARQDAEGDVKIKVPKLAIYQRDLKEQASLVFQFQVHD